MKLYTRKAGSQRTSIPERAEVAIDCLIPGASQLVLLANARTFHFIEPASVEEVDELITALGFIRQKLVHKEFAMAKFTVGLRQWVEEVCEVVVAAPTADEAMELAVSDQLDLDYDWSESGGGNGPEAVEARDHSGNVFKPLPPEFFKMLDLSTGHAPSPFAYTAQITSRAAMSREEGDLLHVPEENDEGDQVPEWLLAIYAYARKHDCAYILFDRDAEVDPNLPSYDW